MAMLMTTPSIFRAQKEWKRIVVLKGGKPGTYDYVYIRNFGKTYGVIVSRTVPKSSARISHLYDLKGNRRLK